MSPRPGYLIPLLFAGAFRRVIDDLHKSLVGQGFADIRPFDAFALQAVDDGCTISELAQRLGVSKQAAAKTVASLEKRGYVSRTPHPSDGRATIVTLTDRSDAMFRASAETLELQRKDWEARLGAQRLNSLLDDLSTIGGGTNLGDFPGWVTRS